MQASATGYAFLKDTEELHSLLYVFYLVQCVYNIKFHFHPRIIFLLYFPIILAYHEVQIWSTFSLIIICIGNVLAYQNSFPQVLFTISSCFQNLRDTW
jgi:hypothetical protein